ncbi:unnamed protein product [Urochloa humidicola]
MRNHAESTASVAGGGGGVGRGAEGRDPADEAWKEEFAVAWDQTNAERAALRSQYAAARDATRELKDDPALGKFDAAMDRIEKLGRWLLFRPLEQLADAEALLDLAEVLISSAKVENRDGPTPSEFVAALLRKFDVTPTPLHDSGKSFSWSSLGDAVSPMFMTAAGCQTMNGPMDLTIKAWKHVVRRQSGCLDSKPAKPHELALDQDESDNTDKNADAMLSVLIQQRRNGTAEINVDGSGNHFVAPRNAPAATLKVVNSQFVFRFDTKDWQIMKRMVKRGEGLLPRRNSYCGGEYKNTQSSSGSDCSQLVSDSEQLKEDEFAKEDPVEFTSDEEMEENLTTWCPGDDTQRKRKRQHVGRRLFSADD